MNTLLTIVALAMIATTGTLLYRDTLHDRVIAPLNRPRDIGEIRTRVLPQLEQAMAQQGMTLGAPIYIRIFKEEAELEVWVQDDTSYRLFRSYPICNYSGHLGPKLAEGDYQSPEGFYAVPRGALNPNSRFHLSFNLGFPNAYDRAHERTGSYLMVHGDCRSVGCYAMTDPAIEEIYLLAEQALSGGQRAVPVHAFPFHMTDTRMAQAAGHHWFNFWEGLQPAYAAFEATHRPPPMRVRGGQYVLAQP
ncbi:MAG: hypothetical protein AB3N23_07400 [Paracoccaceae bacterium]